MSFLLDRHLPPPIPLWFSRLEIAPLLPVRNQPQSGLNLQQLKNLQGSVSAVDTNEEATNLLRFQTAYEAAARIISTVQQPGTVTLNMEHPTGGY